MWPIFLTVLFFLMIQSQANNELIRLELRNISHPLLNNSYLEENTSNLAFLKISSSKIGKIDRNTFDNFTHLNFLELSDTQIESEIDSDTFVNIRSLEKLVFRNISLHRVNLKLSNVQELILSGNYIKEFDGDDVVGGNINYLDISHNEIKYLNSSLESLKHLSTIDVSNNLIKIISPIVFSNNVNLLRIRANRNNINSTDGLKLSRLKYLDLSWNHFESLKTGAFANMKFLEELDLDHNYLKYLEDPFKELFEIRFLDLSNNQISHIKPSLFRNNVYLTKLSIKGNGLTQLHRFEGNFYHLSAVNFAHNKIVSIDPDFFLSMPNVEILDLRKNNLKHVYELFDGLKNLKTLYLQNNEINLGGFEFKKNINLKSLNLASNHLTLGLSHFKSNKKLINLNLSDNLIANFCDADVILENLMKINLRKNLNNDLSCLGRNFNSLCQVDFRNNFMGCGKSLDDLITNLTQKGCTLYDYPEKFNYEVYPPTETQMDIPNDQCVIVSFEQNSALWDKVRREMCPLSHFVPVKASDIIKDTYKSLRENANVEIINSINEKILSDFKNKNEDGTSSKENSRKTIIQDSKSVTLKPQSERISWENIEKDADFVETLEEQEENEVENYAWYTVPVLLIALAFGLTIFNLVVFLYIRFKVWRSFNSSNEKKYTFLQNEVYKNTTEPTNSNQFDKSQLDINPINKVFFLNKINGLFPSFGLNSQKDSESVKNILMDSSQNLNV